MDVEIDTTSTRISFYITDPDMFAQYSIITYGDLLNPRFVINETIYSEQELYNLLASHETPEASCAFLHIIEHLSTLRNNYAELVDGSYDVFKQLSACVRDAYLRYDVYCRGITDDIDIVSDFEQMTL